LEATLLGVPAVMWLAGGLALYMAWTIGANDVANAMGTSVGSGALTLRRAVVVAGALEFGGAFFVGGHVTDTVRKGILSADAVAVQPELLLYGMLGALAAAGTLLLTATRYGLPISTTHSIVGAIVGFGAVGLGLDAVVWSKVAQIVASWVTSPLLGGVLAFLIFNLTRFLILDRQDPMREAKRWGPYFAFVVVFLIGLVTLFKGLKNLKLDFDLPEALALSALAGAIGALVGRFFLRRVKVEPTEQGTERFRQVERVFVVLQIMTACAVAFAHGSNDVANSIGPLAAVMQVAQGVEFAGKAEVAPWMLMVGGIGIVLGLATWGYRVMETVGRRITELTPSRGFAAELAAAMTIVLASRLGIPVSTTHILVGSVLGVGLARGIGALDLRVVGAIMVSWVATLPVAAALAVFFFYFFKGLLTP
jgi:PiT family inorganic phosphate transporter